MKEAFGSPVPVSKSCKNRQKKSCPVVSLSGICMCIVIPLTHSRLRPDKHVLVTKREILFLIDLEN